MTYVHSGLETRVFFPNPAATLPVRCRGGSVVLLPWGRRQSQQGKLPLGGWARLDSIYAGRWDRWFPKPVMLPIQSFMEQDHEGRAHWFDIVSGSYIQGLVAREGHEQRVYVVTIVPEAEDAMYARWPRSVWSPVFPALSSNPI